jgi:tyrosyl-tRNA synthetase
MKNLVEELKWRGLYHDSMPGTEEQLLKEVTTAYIGFDPTADSLHIGSMVQIILIGSFKEFWSSAYRFGWWCDRNDW